jgi:hypothetical protein
MLPEISIFKLSDITVNLSAKIHIARLILLLFLKLFTHPQDAFKGNTSNVN